MRVECNSILIIIELFLGRFWWNLYQFEIAAEIIYETESKLIEIRLLIIHRAINNISLGRS